MQNSGGVGGRVRCDDSAAPRPASIWRITSSLRRRVQLTSGILESFRPLRYLAVWKHAQTTPAASSISTTRSFTDVHRLSLSTQFHTGAFIQPNPTIAPTHLFPIRRIQRTQSESINNPPRGWGGLFAKSERQSFRSTQGSFAPTFPSCKAQHCNHGDGHKCAANAG